MPLAILSYVLCNTPATAKHVLTDPYAIFDRARTYWDSASYPPTVAYDITVRVIHRSVGSTAHYHAYYQTSTDSIHADAISDEERAHPYTPHGVKFGIALTFYKMGSRPIQIGAPDHTFDYLGVPELTPNYSFGLARTPPHVLTTSSPDLVAQIRAEFHDPARARSPSPAPSGMLRTIAAIQITQRRYVVTLAGMATIDGHTDYDLHLTPVTDPSHYRLRELWVDAKSFATDRLVTQGDFTAGELAALRWTVDFQQIEGAPFVESEHTSSAFTFDRRHYDDATVSFTNIAVRAMPSYTSLATFAVDPETAPEILIEPPAPRD